MKISEKVQERFLPYGRQCVTEADIEAVTDVLRSDWLTQGPAVPAFESELADTVGASHSVACTNGTAALHLAMLALGIGLGDVIVTPSITFLASANCGRFVGADVRFTDIDRDTGLIDVDSLQRVLKDDTEGRIKAVIPVHFAGQPADLTMVAELARGHGAAVVDDACHAIGAWYERDELRYKLGGGPHSDLTVFSFHPVKHVAMGEGGAVTTNDPELAARLRRFRCHGMQKEDFANTEMAHAPDGPVNPWYYEMQELGYNYRLTDIQAALGLSQLRRLSWSLERRNEIAGCYRQLIAQSFPEGNVRPLTVDPGRYHAYHLFVVRIDFAQLGLARREVITGLRDRGIGTQVHYIPVHLQPYYRNCCGTRPGDFPEAESYYEQALSLPMYPELTEQDCERVVEELHGVLHRKATCRR